MRKTRIAPRSQAKMSRAMVYWVTWWSARASMGCDIGVKCWGKGGEDGDVFGAGDGSDSVGAREVLERGDRGGIVDGGVGRAFVGIEE